MNRQSHARYLAGFAVLLATIALFQLWRYDLPAQAGTNEQQATWLAHIENGTGVRLPSGTMVLVSKDEEMRQDPYAEYWVIFSAEPFDRVPIDVHLNRFVQPDLADTVRVIENGISPFKIYKPLDVTYHRWTNKHTQLEAYIVAASRGWYMSLQVLHDESAEQPPMTPAELMDR